MQRIGEKSSLMHSDALGCTESTCRQPHLVIFTHLVLDHVFETWLGGSLVYRQSRILPRVEGWVNRSYTGRRRQT